MYREYSGILNSDIPQRCWKGYLSVSGSITISKEYTSTRGQYGGFFWSLEERSWVPAWVPGSLEVRAWVPGSLKREPVSQGLLRREPGSQDLSKCGYGC